MSAANKNDSNRLSGKRKRDKDCRSLLLDAVLAKLTPLCAPAAVPKDVKQRIISRLDRIMTAEQDSKDVVDNKDKWVYECVIELLAEIMHQKDDTIAEIIQQKDAIIQQKDETIQLKDETLQLKDETIQLKDAIIQQKDGKFQGLIVDRLMDFYNDTCDKSLVKQRKRMKLRRGRDCKRSSHTTTNHVQAKIDVSGDFAMDPIKVKTAGDCPITSLLLAGRWPAMYVNEFEVQKYVERGLDDAVAYINWLLSKSLGIETSLIVRKEASIFSNKPDHLVVYYESSQLLPILCVETKKPSEKVFTSKTVSGQIFDYLMVAKMLHGRPTFGVLTTFNKSKVVWDVDCQNEAKNNERLSPEAIQQTVTILAPQALAEGKLPDTDSTQTPEEIAQAPWNGNRAETPAAWRVEAKSEKKTDSPPDLIECADAAIHNQSETPIGANLGEQSRQIKYSSTTYRPWQLFTVFCHGIVASLNMGRQKHKIMLAKKLLKGQTVLVLKKSQHAWDTLSQDYNIKEKPWKVKVKSTSNLEFIVTGVVGLGATSRVWNAVVKTNGTRRFSTCVVKYWIKTYDPETAIDLTDNEIKTESDETTKREVENYKKIYHNLFFGRKAKALVGRVKLDRWCVVLPLFRPIEKADRLAVLEQIRFVLGSRFYKKKSRMSYQFPETDRRWRHIGRWQGDQIVLFDLADLEVKRDYDEKKHINYVNQHIKTLEDRINDA